MCLRLAEERRLEMDMLEVIRRAAWKILLQWRCSRCKRFASAISAFVRNRKAAERAFELEEECAFRKRIALRRVVEDEEVRVRRSQPSRHGHQHAAPQTDDIVSAEALAERVRREGGDVLSPFNARILRKYREAARDRALSDRLDSSVASVQLSEAERNRSLHALLSQRMLYRERKIVMQDDDRERADADDFLRPSWDELSNVVDCGADAAGDCGANAKSCGDSSTIMVSHKKPSSPSPKRSRGSSRRQSSSPRSGKRSSTSAARGALKTSERNRVKAKIADMQSSAAAHTNNDNNNSNNDSSGSDMTITEPSSPSPLQRQRLHQHQHHRRPVDVLTLSASSYQSLSLAVKLLSDFALSTPLLSYHSTANTATASASLAAASSSSSSSHAS